MIEDLLLSISATGFTLSAIPQILLLFKTKNSANVSLLRSSIILGCLVLTVVASASLELWMTVLINGIQLWFVLALIILILKYR